MGQAPESVSHPDPADYEAACLMATQEQLARYDDWLQEARGRRAMRSVRLDGSHPDTAIIVEFGQPGRAQPVTVLDFPLWDEMFEEADGTRAPPQSVAALVWSEVTENLP
jgi:hypothetical protein